jgi:hypothetical protein
MFKKSKKSENIVVIIYDDDMLFDQFLKNSTNF